ncbi:phycobilisome rod-core linker polypeptide (plastid) [Chondrus crispus]|uniref:Phycobilisome rod-core linker polypeptide n=3 Tax=Gigartinaceae TaxID=29217 RepID=M5DET7_CHOCR|nr:phycobilisome rod-core linker polypeptide [Chondrus crispus]CCP38211.1 phycobilisome rod-core linker polypeptide [Chondrus crispus]|eukprot:YP_007627464.1 phycobilisome rod-core linker polypeptide (plastid) [Chondrus crispus]
MSIPILNYAFSTQNQRVDGFEYLPGEEQPKIYTTENLPTAYEMDEIIWSGYRQIFSEHQILSSTNEPFLESQLRFNQITIKDFIKGLLLSQAFRNLNYDVNNNYRFVEMCIQRVLGRDIYNEREKLAFSVLIGSKGLEFFVDVLLNSDEYVDNFGDNTIPYQRRRIIAQRSKGEIPFNLKTPRTGKEFLMKQERPQLLWAGSIRKFRPQEQSPKAGDPALFLNMVTDVSPISLG